MKPAKQASLALKQLIRHELDRADDELSEAGQPVQASHERMKLNSAQSHLDDGVRELEALARMQPKALGIIVDVIDAIHRSQDTLDRLVDRGVIRDPRFARR